MTPEDVAAQLRAAPAHAGLVLDFDGTLAPIVEDPERSALPPGAAPVLERLARRLAVVALLSGRPAAFLAERAPVPGVLLLGAYGAQVHRDGELRTADAVAPWLPAVRDAATSLRAALDGSDGVHVEDKGLAVAVHWRRAADRDAAERRVAGVVDPLAERTGLHREAGKFVIELRAPGVDKGSALGRLADDAGLTTLVYAGDDLGDLPAFAATRERGGTCLVVRHGAETAPEVAAAGDVHFDGVPALTAWLADLATTLD